MAKDIAEALDAGGDNGRPGRHRLQEDDAEALLSSVGCAEDIGGLVVTWELLIGDEAGEVDVLELVPLDVALAGGAHPAVRPYHDEASVGHLPLQLGIGR